MCTSELVKNELKGKKAREIEKKHKELSVAISNIKYYVESGYIDVKVNDKLDLDILCKKIDDDIDGFFQDKFGKNIISLQNKQEMIDILFERNRMKRPPFNAGESDKGFMDTLIWVGFLNYCNENKFDRYVFVTNDNDFIKHSSSLKKEFKSYVKDGEIIIRKFSNGKELLQHFGIVEKTSEIITDYIKPSIDQKIFASVGTSKEFITEVQDAVESIMLSKPDWNAYQSYNFRFDKKFEIFDVENFCNELLKEQFRFLFLKYVDLTDIFSSVGFNSVTIEKIDINSLNKFIEIWKLISHEKNEFKMPFLELVKVSLNDMVTLNQGNSFINNPNYDLPF